MMDLLFDVVSKHDKCILLLLLMIPKETFSSKSKKIDLPLLVVVQVLLLAQHLLNVVLALWMSLQLHVPKLLRSMSTWRNRVSA